MTLNAAADPMTPVPYRVTRIQAETHDTVTFDCQPADGGPPFGFMPGQFSMVYAFGAGEVPLGLSGHPDRPGTLTHTVRGSGAVTRALARLQEGDVVGIRGPFGRGWPLEGARDHDIVVVMGGIGAAALRALVLYVLERREEFANVSILYGARTPEDFLYVEDLKTWRGRFDMEVLITVDRASQDWRGHVGVVPKLIPRASFEPFRTIAYMCGPEIMMRYTIDALDKAGVAPSNIHLSMERNMKCAIGFCGHCQFGPTFICKDGPVFSYDRLSDLLAIREL